MKHSIKLAGIVALVLMVASPAFAQTGGRRTDAAFKFFSSGTYHMKAIMYAAGMPTTTIETYAKGDNMALISTSQNMSSRMINKGNKTYIIMDSEKRVMVMALQDNDQPGTDTDNMKFLGSGTADFRGKSLPYEEFTELDSSDDTKVRYFFDGTKLAGIRSIGSGVTMDMEVLALDQNIPGNVFDIPSGYQVTDMSTFGR